MSTGRNTKKYGPNCGIDFEFGSKWVLLNEKQDYSHCKQQWNWPACANAQAGQFHCCLLAGGDITI